MNIGELFINLGIKGSDKTVGQLDKVKSGLKDTASMSLEAKAAIVGAMYALERLFAKSGAAGTGLTNFNALTGLSAKQLQQWQYAARQAGVANEEFEGSVKGVQNSMTNMLMGKGAPEGLAMLASKVGFDAKKARDTFYVMQKMQEFARQAPPDVGNAVLKSFGASEGTIAAMRRNAFNQKAFNQAPTYSDKEISALDRANTAWSNLGTKIEMAVGRFNAMHGGQLVKDISSIVDKVVKLAEAFTVLAEKLKVFQVIGKVFEGWAHIFSGISAGVDAVSGAIDDPKKRGELVDDTVSGAKGVVGFMASMAGGMGESLSNFIKGPATPTPSNSPGVIAPAMPAGAGRGGGGGKSEVKIEQNLHFNHDGKDAQKTSSDLKRANQDAFRQYSQGQVN